MPLNILGIAIDCYDDASIVKLNNCQSDLSTVVTLLQSKYEVNDITLLLKREETTKRFIYNTIYSSVVNSLKDDSLLLFFAGHGQYNDMNEQPYWLAADSFSTEQSSWLLVSEILSFLKNAEIKHFCLIADNCYSGAILKQELPGAGAGASEDLKSRHAITSGSIEKVKDGLPGKASPFNKVLCDLIKQNSLNYPVSILGDHVLSNFPKEVNQNPRSGVISEVGDDGGNFILKVKEENLDVIFYKTIKLPLKVTQTIDFSCDLISFEYNKIFNSTFVNIAVQDLGYEILENLREDLTNGYLKDSSDNNWNFHIDCNINMVSDKFVSLRIVIDGFLGGPYAFTRIETINITIDSNKKVYLGNLFNIENEVDFFTDIIKRHSDDDEQREALLGYVKAFTVDEVRFSLDKDSISLHLDNYIPKVIQCYAYLRIPLAEYDIDLGNIYKIVER